MRILFLNVTGALGGAERLLLDLLASLRQADPNIELHLALGDRGPLEPAARALGIAVHLLPLPENLLRFGESNMTGRGALHRVCVLARHGLPLAWSAWKYAGRLRSFIKSLNPDVVHSNSLKLHLMSALTGKRGPLVVWHLHDFVSGRALSERGLCWAARRAGGAIAISRAVAEDTRSRLSGLQVETIRNAVDTERFSPGLCDGMHLDRLAGLPVAARETVRIGLVATYASWKGHDVFLDAARIVRDKGGPLTRFYVIGGRIYRTQGSQWNEAELRLRAARVPGQYAVGFIGFQADLVPVYRGLDVIVHASTRPEPFGLTVAEAMACGRAVVVAPTGGARELFTHDHDALGVSPGNADALASTLTSLAANPEKRRLLGNNARKSAVAQCDRARLGPQLLAAYSQFRRAAGMCPRLLATAG